jgi:hypothetical protein
MQPLIFFNFVADSKLQRGSGEEAGSENIFGGLERIGKCTFAP